MESWQQDKQTAEAPDSSRLSATDKAPKGQTWGDERPSPTMCDSLISGDTTVFRAKLLLQSAVFLRWRDEHRQTFVCGLGLSPGVCSLTHSLNRADCTWDGTLSLCAQHHTNATTVWAQSRQVLTSALYNNEMACLNLPQLGPDWRVFWISKWVSGLLQDQTQEEPKLQQATEWPGYYHGHNSNPDMLEPLRMAKQPRDVLSCYPWLHTRVYTHTHTSPECQCSRLCMCELKRSMHEVADVKHKQGTTDEKNCSPNDQSPHPQTAALLRHIFAWQGLLGMEQAHAQCYLTSCAFLIDCAPDCMHACMRIQIAIIGMIGRLEDTCGAACAYT